MNEDNFEFLGFAVSQDLGNAWVDLKTDVRDVVQNNPYRQIEESFRKAKESILLFGRQCGKITLALGYMQELYDNYNQIRVNKMIVVGKYRAKRKHNRMFK